MKKIAVCIAAVILSVFCSVPAAAAGRELPEETASNKMTVSPLRTGNGDTHRRK